MVENKFKSGDEVVCVKTPLRIKTPLKRYNIYTVKEAKIFEKSSGISLNEVIEECFFSELYFEKLESLTAKSEELTNFVNSIFMKNGK